MDLDLRVLPDPYLSHAEAAVDLELVDSAARPYDFDSQVGRILALVADEVAFVWLQSTLLRRILECPGTVGGEVDPSLERVGLDEAADVGLREAVERTATPSEFKKYLLLDVIETYLPVPEDERERWEELLSREENRAVRDFERTWAERLMLTGFFEGKRQTLKRQLSTKFGYLPPWVEGRIDAVASEDELDAYLEGVLTASSLAEMGLDG